MPHPMRYPFWGSLGEDRRWLAMEHCMEKVVPRLALKGVWSSDEGMPGTQRCLASYWNSRWLIPSLCN